MITPGIDLFDAIDACLIDGAFVSCTEIRSKKGVDGGSPRVVHMRKNGNAIELLFAFFQCSPENGSEDK